MIGLLVIQVLRAKGCRRILAVDPDATRRALAEQLGAERAVPPDAANIRDMDVAYEVVGRPDTVLAAVRSVRKGGTVVLIGNLSPRVEIPLQEVVSRELSLLGSCASSGEYPRCIDLLAQGAIDVRPLISATASLEEGPSWFSRLHRGEAGVMKVILRP
jgi:L-iditol 2-dehydrogenase